MERVGVIVTLSNELHRVLSFYCLAKGTFTLWNGAYLTLGFDNPQLPSRIAETRAKIRAALLHIKAYATRSGLSFVYLQSVGGLLLSEPDDMPVAQAIVQGLKKYHKVDGTAKRARMNGSG